METKLQTQEKHKPLKIQINDDQDARLVSVVYKAHVQREVLVSKLFDEPLCLTIGRVKGLERVIKDPVERLNSSS